MSKHLVFPWWRKNFLLTEINLQQNYTQGGAAIFKKLINLKKITSRWCTQCDFTIDLNLKQRNYQLLFQIDYILW